MKKLTAEGIFDTILFCAPIIAAVVCEFIDEEGRLYFWLAMYIAFLGWTTIYTYIKNEMSDKENPGTSARLMHFAVLFIVAPIYKDDPMVLNKFEIGIALMCVVCALSYHYKRHFEYKDRYEKLLKENKELREKINDGYNT